MTTPKDLRSSPTSVSDRIDRIYHQLPLAEAAYVLPADEEEGRRLQEQHDLFESHFCEGQLVPEYVQLGSNAKVLDAGTGNGVWVLDLASKLPSTASFVATDISTRLFPASHPSNITFLNHSTISPLLSEWKNAFDLVHQRLMIGAFRPSEWVTAIANFYEALKPGGYVIIMDCGESQHGPKGSATERIWSAVVQMASLRGIQWGQCIVDMPRLLEEAGFVDIRVSEYRFIYGENDALRRNVMAMLKGLSGRVENLTWNGTAGEYEATVDEAEVEYAGSRGLGASYMWFTAQKPS